jgi:predicted RNA binding protein YcfA (HicA-like mRNA interferase family)
VRQNGSHVRIQTNEKGRHSETIPNHNPLKAGTLRQILKNIALDLELSLDELEDELF